MHSLEQPYNKPESESEGKEGLQLTIQILKEVAEQSRATD